MTESVNPLSLPSLPLKDLKNFPEIPAIYFVISESHEVIYIGKASNLLTRWKGHHRKKQLFKQSVRVAWLEFTDTSSLRLAEKNLIEEFKPVLNGRKLPDEDKDRDRVSVDLRGIRERVNNLPNLPGLEPLRQMNFAQLLRLVFVRGLEKFEHELELMERAQRNK